MSEVVDLETQRLQTLEQLDQINGALATDPDNEDLKGIKTEILGLLTQIEVDIAQQEAANKKQPEKKAQEKTTSKNTDEQKNEAASEPTAPIKYVVNDDVLAKWISGDKGFYPARIQSVTGSSNDPVYTVKFKNYDDIETLRSKDIRPLGGSNTGGANPGTKRKADLMENAYSTAGPASPAGAFPPAVAGSSTGAVVQKAAEKYTTPADTTKKDDEKPRPKYKKMKPTKELEANKSNWQNFTAKGKFGKNNKAFKKDSQFRVPDGVNARVGFVGSGQTMRKDVTRTRHVYQVAEDDN